MILGSIYKYLIFFLSSMCLLFLSMFSYMKVKYKSCAIYKEQQQIKNKLAIEEYNRNLREMKEKEHKARKQSDKNIKTIEAIMSETLSSNCNKAIQYGIEKASFIYNKNY